MPLKTYSLPSDPRWTNRQMPPGLTSILTTVVISLFRPHHCGMRFGSVYALNMSSRGALKTLVMTISRSVAVAVRLFLVIMLIPHSFYGTISIHDAYVLRR